MKRNLLFFATLLVVAPSFAQEAAPETAPAAKKQEPAEHPLAKEARDLRATMEELLADKKSKLKTTESKKARLRLHTDYKSSRDPKAALKATEEVLQALEWGFGPYEEPEEIAWHRDDHPFELYMIQKEELYFRIIDEVARVAPRYQAFLESCRNGTGFTLYPAKLSIYYHNVKIQAEARVEHSIAHNAAHLEMHRRFGFTPLQIAEGVACAAEDLALEEIWANWYRDEFVLAVSHGGWRGAATQTAVKRLDLSELWKYPAKPYDDDRAHLAFGFAIFALEEKPLEFAQMLHMIQAEYDRHPEQGGLFQLKPAELAALAEKAFGPSLQDDLRAYWEKVPKRPKVNKARKS